MNYFFSYVFCHCHFVGLFEIRAQDYLDSLPGIENRGVNKFLKGLGKSSHIILKLVSSDDRYLSGYEH